jgi:hypothetical protein
MRALGKGAVAAGADAPASATCATALSAQKKAVAQSNPAVTAVFFMAINP